MLTYCDARKSWTFVLAKFENCFFCFWLSFCRISFWSHFFQSLAKLIKIYFLRSLSPEKRILQKTIICGQLWGILLVKNLKLITFANKIRKLKIDKILVFNILKYIVGGMFKDAECPDLKIEDV